MHSACQNKVTSNELPAKTSLMEEARRTVYPQYEPSSSRGLDGGTAFPSKTAAVGSGSKNSTRHRIGQVRARLTFSRFAVVRVDPDRNPHSRPKDVINQNGMLQSHIYEAADSSPTRASSRSLVQGNTFSEATFLMLAHVMRRIEWIQQPCKL